MGNESMHYLGIPMEDIWHLPQARAHHSLYGMLAKDWEHLIRRGLGATSMLKWSPTGDYIFTAKFDGTFYLWETNTWTTERWSSAGGFVTGATWDPDGRMILISFSES